MSRGNITPTTAANHFSFQFSAFPFFTKQMLQQRRRSKLIGFIIAEASAIGFLLVAGTFAVLFKKADPTLALSINIATIAAAAAAALIPIIYFAVAPVLPRDDR